MLNATERVAAGLHLAKIGDPRQEMLDVDTMKFCPVPEGSFFLGSSDNPEKITEEFDVLLILVRLKTVDIHHIRLAWKLAGRYGFSHYDSLMVASALEAGCKHLYSEDMQHGQIIENSLQIINPFLEESRA